jgi:inner membrane protein
MATLGHLAIGIAVGRAAARGRSPFGPMAFFGALACLPDLDLLAFPLGIPYAATWGHRGALHSLAAAAAAGAMAFLALRGSPQRLRLSLLAFGAFASHIALDAVTRGGLGVAALWPFSTARHFAPFSLLPVAPIGRALWSTPRGQGVLAFEIAAFAPFWLYALWPRRKAQPSKAEALSARSPRAGLL